MAMVWKPSIDGFWDDDKHETGLWVPDNRPSGNVGGGNGSIGTGSGAGSNKGNVGGGGYSSGNYHSPAYKAPEYNSRYDQQINDILNQILNRGPFTYNHETDPTYKQYEKAYTNYGDRAMEDTLGKLSAKTGGLASSYAGSVAQQTYNGYMNELSNKIPELEQLAYNMYLGETNAMFDKLNALQQLEQMDYAKYRDSVSDYNSSYDRTYKSYKANSGNGGNAGKSGDIVDSLNALVNGGLMDADTAASIYLKSLGFEEPEKKKENKVYGSNYVIAPQGDKPGMSIR